MTSRSTLDILNNNQLLCAHESLSEFYNDDENPSNIILQKSFFLDLEKLAADFSNSNSPLVFSINIQSLNSKFEKLKILISTLIAQNVCPDIIVLQETWNVPYPDLFSLPGYSPLIVNNRNYTNGGGVGFYVKSNLEFHIVNNIVPSLKPFENITIELKLNNKNIVLSNFIFGMKVFLMEMHFLIGERSSSSFKVTVKKK